MTGVITTIAVGDVFSQNEYSWEPLLIGVPTSPKWYEILIYFSFFPKQYFKFNN